MAIAALDQGIGDDDAGLRWSGKLTDARLRARTQAGFLYLRKEWDAATRALEDVVRQDPKDALALNLLGWALLDAKKDLAGASGMFDRAIAADPDLLGPRLGKCAVLEREGKKAEARALYEETAARRPRDPWAQYHLGWFLINEGKPGEASPVFEKAIGQDPTNAEFQRSLGVAFLYEDKLGEAIERYRTAIRYDQRNPWAYS